MQFLPPPEPPVCALRATEWPTTADCQAGSECSVRTFRLKQHPCFVELAAGIRKANSFADGDRAQFGENLPELFHRPQAAGDTAI
jgi:hypothetical protein